MKVILIEDVDNLGKTGEILSVKNGFGRNYLIPNKLALLANDKTIKSIQKDLERREIKEANTVRGLTLLSEKLNKVTLKFDLKAGEDDKLFGSVTTQMISDMLNKSGYDIDKKDIIIEDSIKAVGNHYSTISLGQDISARIKIKVKAEK